MSGPDLYDAISDADADEVRRRLAQGADVGHRYGDDSTPLHVAVASCGWQEPEMIAPIVRLLLEAGADPNARQRNGDTPYDLAEHEELAALLRPVTTPARLSDEELAEAAALRRDLDLLRAEVEPLVTPRHAEPAGRCGAEQARAALAAAAAKRVVRWQWLSNAFHSCVPHHSERHRFPRPRLLRQAPTARELRSGVTQLGVDRDGRLALERWVMHTKEGIVHEVVYRRLAPDLVCAVCVDHQAMKWAWCARVVDGRPVTMVHVGGRAEANRWEGRRLARVEHWARLDRRTRRSGHEELTHDLAGRLLSVEHVYEDGQRSMTFRRKALGESMKSVAAAVRAELVRAIPEAVQRAAIREPAYCLVVAWCGAFLLPPDLGVGLERERVAWRATGDQSVWAAPEFEHFETDALELDDPDVVRVCARMVELLHLSESSGALVATLRDVARDLNRLDWSKLLPVTDDFVVFPCDVELVGLAGHLRAVLGASRVKQLTAAMGSPPPD